MICPECHADYLDHIQECGDCQISLVDACPIDLPIPDMTWSSLPPFEGKIYADMAAESIELSKSRILQQAATSMLSQANKTMQSVLELLS